MAESNVGCPACGKSVLVAENGEVACSDPKCLCAHGVPKVLLFMGIKPTLEDDTHWSSVRCQTCPDKPNLRAVVRGGRIVDAGCPLCHAQHWVEVTMAGSRVSIDFFPPGITVI